MCRKLLLPILLLDVIYFLQVTIISACAQKDVTKVNSNYKLATNIVCNFLCRVEQYILLLIRSPNLSFNISLNCSERNTHYHTHINILYKANLCLAVQDIADSFKFFTFRIMTEKIYEVLKIMRPLPSNKEIKGNTMKH